MELIRSPSLWSTFLKNNGYIIHNCVGAGSFGDVFAVTKVTTGVKLALKRVVVRGKVADDSHVKAEIHALVLLNHKNIVALEEFLLCRNLACIIMELAPGGNLEMKMAEHSEKMNETFIKISFRQILSAVEYCHGFDIAHRDINPSNILIFSDNLVKLADFGLCVRCTDEPTGKRILCTDYLGQESFLAPEVKLNQPFHAKPADVWSLGCILFFVVYRVNPPDSETEFWEQMKTSLTRLQHSNKNNNSELTYLNIIQKMCASNVSHRPELPELISLWDLEL